MGGWWVNGWRGVCIFICMSGWMDEWRIGTTDGRTDSWMGGKEERKKVWRKKCIL